MEERESFLIEIVNDSSTQPGAITFGMPSNISIIDNDGEFGYIIFKSILCYTHIIYAFVLYVCMHVYKIICKILDLHK